ncbi:MAG: glycosyltransferase [Bacteroidales bacterium]|nr:glycosyltransferase [Bacteroidales bacterium]
MMLILLAGWAILFIYLFIILLLWIGWLRLPTEEEKDNSCNISVSIIIAARNEDVTIPDLLKDLKSQSYPRSLFEIIIIDDHSENKISQLQAVNELNMENLKIIELPQDKNGKKEALIYGARKSNSELILFTDADCRVGENWIKSFVTKYHKQKPSVIIGLVDYLSEDALLQNYYRLDFLSLIVSGAGAAGLGKPVLCNGANLALKRNLYLNLQDKLMKQHRSGDDVFILHAVKATKKEKIELLKSRDAVVYTHPPHNIAEFNTQRMRWASKAPLYYDFDTVFLGSLVLLTCAFLLLSIVYSVLNENFFYCISLFAIKTTADCFIITAGLRFFGKLKQILFLPLFQLIYPMYVLGIFFFGLFVRISWKGR